MFSFVGTGNYQLCRYQLSDHEPSNVVKYVQETLANLFFSNYKDNDRIYLLMTDTSIQKHKIEIEKALSGFPLEIIDGIPENFTEKDNWEIFSKVFGLIQEKDEVILDITHAFRSFTSLGTVMLSYAKALKSISVGGIYYGAFEALGPSFDINDRIPDPNDRVAPLVNMSIYSDLQEWTYASATYVDTGSPVLIKKLVNDFIKPRLIRTEGRDEVSKQMQIISRSLDELESQMSTCRSFDLLNKTSINRANEALLFLTSDGIDIPPAFAPLLLKIKENLYVLKATYKYDWFPLVEYCIRYGKIQQGITQFQEGLISEFCRFSLLDPKAFSERELISQGINIKLYKIPIEKWRQESIKNKSVIERIINSDKIESLLRIYSSLSSYRNDINHAGYRPHHISANSFQSSLSRLFEEAKSILNGYISESCS